MAEEPVESEEPIGDKSTPNVLSPDGRRSVLRAVQNGGGGRPKMVALGCRKRISSTQQNGSGSRFTTVFGVLEAVDFALGLQDVAAPATAYCD